MWKNNKLVMLPTSEKSKLCIYKGNKLIWLGKGLISKTSDSGFNNQHLYITSDEEIKVGDWIFDNYAKINLIQQVRVCDLESSHNRNGNWHKIIATTDERLRIDSTIRITQDDDYGKVKFIIPLIYKQFIEKYIEEYNKGNIITDVLVEYVQVPNQVFISEINAPYVQLKINPDNTINIKPIKDSWSREDINKLVIKLKSLPKEKQLEITESVESFDKWIEENL